MPEDQLHHGDGKSFDQVAVIPKGTNLQILGRHPYRLQLRRQVIASSSKDDVETEENRFAENLRDTESGWT